MVGMKRLGGQHQLVGVGGGVGGGGIKHLFTPGDIEKELKTAGLKWGTAARKVYDRENWRDIVRALWRHTRA